MAPSGGAPVCPIAISGSITKMRPSIGKQLATARISPCARSCALIKFPKLQDHRGSHHGLFTKSWIFAEPTALLTITIGTQLTESMGSQLGYTELPEPSLFASSLVGRNGRFPTFRKLRQYRRDREPIGRLNLTQRCPVAAPRPQAP